jgi:predicted RNA-binding protein with PIN domain
MRFLIDGYNLMYAAGLLGRQLGPDGFRKVRQRFLNDLAAVLDPVEAHQTTVVFDASAAPPDLPRETSHKGLTVEFAVEDENADARIEWLIAHHATPKTLTVVSSDHRIRQAAHRRKSQEITSEAFLERLDLLKERKKPRAEPPPSPEDLAREHVLSAEESAYWESEFRDVPDDPQMRAQLRDDSPMITDEEIARIKREVEREP